MLTKNDLYVNTRTINAKKWPRNQIRIRITPIFTLYNSHIINLKGSKKSICTIFHLPTFPETSFKTNYSLS